MSDYQYLELMGVYVLRNLAREIGVQSPTSKTKSTLIKEIIEIKEGLREPAPKTNKGAPTKSFGTALPPWQTDENETYKPIVEEQKHDKVCDNQVTFDKKLVEGVIEVHASGYAFLRTNNYESSSGDVYVSLQNVRKYRLIRGDFVKGYAKLVRENSSPALTEVISINDERPEKLINRKYFDDLIPCFPSEKYSLENSDESDLSLRCLDLLAPIGRGQRGLIVSPPKAGKTTLLKKIASAIEEKYGDAYLIVLLIDERPEEVTDIKKCVKGEVVYSTFDAGSEHHIHIAELVMSRAKRLVECGKDVVILLDSITKLARAYNNTVAPSGRTLSGGLDPNALQAPKRFFGAARNIDGGGSLTILATALVETGSRMDDVIYEEFKGTGNMEIHLSRDLSERRIFPAIDLYKSGTRRDDLLLSKKELDCAIKVRQLLRKENATEILFDMMSKTKDNSDFIEKMDEWLKIYKKNGND